MSFDTRWKRFLNLTAFNRESTLIFNWSLNEYGIDIFHSFGYHTGRGIVSFYLSNQRMKTYDLTFEYAGTWIWISNKLDITV